MSQGAARRTQSSINFGAKSQKEDNSSGVDTLHVIKRPRTEMENDSTAIPDVMITNTDEDIHSSTSTSTVIEVPINNNYNNYDVLKLDRLIDKSDRFESHRNFLNDCIRNKVIPVGLQINLTPTIGNNNDEFVDRWYKRLEECSITMMKDIVEFCDKTITETNESAVLAREKVKSTRTPADNKKVTDAIPSNQTVRKQNLRRSKQKKFHFLKYNRATLQQSNNIGRRQQDAERNNARQNNENLSRNEQPRGNAEPRVSNTNIARKPSGTNLKRQRSNTNVNKNPLWSSLFKQQPRNINNSERNATTNVEQPQQRHREQNQQVNISNNNEIQGMKNDIAQIKQLLFDKQQNKTNESYDQQPKNELAVPSNGRDATTETSSTNNPEVNSILDMISTTMATLREFEKRYKK